MKLNKTYLLMEQLEKMVDVPLEYFPNSEKLHDLKSNAIYTAQKYVRNPRKAVHHMAISIANFLASF